MLEEWENWRQRPLPENQGLSHPMKGPNQMQRSYSSLVETSPVSSSWEDLSRELNKGSATGFVLRREVGWSKQHTTATTAKSLEAVGRQAPPCSPSSSHTAASPEAFTF